MHGVYGCGVASTCSFFLLFRRVDILIITLVHWTEYTKRVDLFP